MIEIKNKNIGTANELINKLSDEYKSKFESSGIVIAIGKKGYFQCIKNRKISNEITSIQDILVSSMLDTIKVTDVIYLEDYDLYLAFFDYVKQE